LLEERSLQHNTDLFVCFVDYEKACDRVNWCKLLETLTKIGMEKRDRELIKTLYMGQTAVVSIDGVDSEPGIIGRGVRQGCPLSPLLFNIYIHSLVDEALQNIEDGMKVGGHLVNAIRFADNRAMIVNSKVGLQRIMDTLNQTTEKYGTRISIKKTKMLRISKNEAKQLTINIDGNKLE
jgi:retron-type reverse transcriptase